MRFGFVYLWYDKKRKKFYLGSHLGLPEDGYVGSNHRLKCAYKSRPETFKRRILESHINITPKQLLQREQLWLDLIQTNELSVRYYNEKKVAAGGNIVGNLPKEKKKQHAIKSGIASKKYWDNISSNEMEKRKQTAFGGNTFDRSYMQSETYRNKMSLIVAGDKNPFYGKKHSDKTKKIMSMKKTGIVPWIKGKFHTEESKLLVKMNNPNRKTFITPDGIFLSGEDYAKTTEKLTSNGIRNILKDRHKPLTKMRINRCSLFNQEQLNKTPFELGYRYENEI
jgi:hypothetical protein